MTIKKFKTYVYNCRQIEATSIIHRHISNLINAEQLKQISANANNIQKREAIWNCIENSNAIIEVRCPQGLAPYVWEFLLEKVITKISYLCSISKKDMTKKLDDIEKRLSTRMIVTEDKDIENFDLIYVVKD